MADTDSKPPEAPAGTVTFGAWLKNQRLAKKVALEEIAAVTKIHIGQLRALEEGWSGQKPAPTFVRGFIVSYAKHLNLNEGEVMEQFSQHAGEFKDKISAVKNQTPPTTYTATSGKPLRFGSYSERKDQLKLTHWISAKRATYVCVALVCLALIFFLVRLGKHASEENQNTVAPVAKTDSQAKNDELLSPQPLQTKITDQSADATPSVLFSGNPPFDVSLTSSGDCWINLKVDDSSLESFKLAAGQTRKVVFNRKAKITLSNPALIKFHVGENEYKSSSPAGSADTLSFPEQATKLVLTNPKAAL